MAATKSTPDSVDLKLSNHSTTAAPSLRQTTPRWPRWLPTTASRRWWTSTASTSQRGSRPWSRHQGSQRSPGRRHCRSAGLRARKPRQLASQDASISVDTGGGLEDCSRPPGRRDRQPSTPPSPDAGRPAFHGGRVGHATGRRHQDSKCPTGSCPQDLRRSAACSRDASISALHGSKADATLLASYATNAALSQDHAPECPRRNRETTSAIAAALLAYYTSAEVGRLPDGERAGHTDAGRHCGRAAGLPDGPGPKRFHKEPDRLPTRTRPRPRSAATPSRIAVRGRRGCPGQRLSVHGYTLTLPPTSWCNDPLYGSFVGDRAPWQDVLHRAPYRIAKLHFGARAVYGLNPGGRQLDRGLGGHDGLGPAAEARVPRRLRRLSLFRGFPKRIPLHLGGF